MGLTTVRAYLPSWIVQDGQLPELGPGDLVELGLTLWCWERTFKGESVVEGMTLLDQPDPQGHVGALHEVTGRVRWTSLPHAWVLAIGDVLLAVNDEVVKHASEEPAVRVGWRRPPRVPTPPPVGSVITARGTVAVAADYEWDNVEAPDPAPDGRRPWRVRRVILQQSRWRRWVRAPSGPSTVGTTEMEVARIDRWGDEPPGVLASYLVDLEPLPNADPGHVSSVDLRW